MNKYTWKLQNNSHKIIVSLLSPPEYVRSWRNAVSLQDTQQYVLRALGLKLELLLAKP